MIRNKAIWWLIFLAILTDTSANPLIGARVYCKYGSALTSSPNGTALIEDLPAGQCLVTACAQGYKSKSQLVTVTAESQATATFALESQSGIILWLTADPTRIPPDGTSTSAITAHVTDLEGAPLSGRNVTITTDMSTFQETSTDTVTGSTNDQGILSATLVSLTTPNTATLTATCEGLTARAYVEFAEASYPSVLVLTPEYGSTLSELVTIAATVRKADARGPAVVSESAAYVDGNWVGCPQVDGGESGGIVDTRELPNGEFILRVSATDMDGNTMWSQGLPVTIYNVISDIRTSCGIFQDDTTPGSIGVTGMMNESGTWSVVVSDTSDNSVFSESGSGPGQIDADWDGKIGGSYVPGIYRMRFTTSTGGLAATGTDNSWLPVTIAARNGTALITGLIRYEPENQEGDCFAAESLEEMSAVFQACLSVGISCTVIADPQWYTGLPSQGGGGQRTGMVDWLVKPYKYWFYVGHGNWQKVVGDYQYRTFIQFDDGIEVPGDDFWLLDDNLRANQPAFSDLGIGTSNYEIIHLSCCNSAGYIGDHLDDSIALAFNIDNSSEGQVYLGYDTLYYPFEWPYEYPCGTGLDGRDWTKAFWGYLAQGYTVSQAYDEVLLHPIVNGYDGYMHNALVTIGDPWTAWLSDW